MLWEGNRQIQEYTNHHIFTTVYDQDSFEPVSRLVQDRQDTSQIKVYHYHNNHLGTPQELTDECGNVVWANYEWAWGGTYQRYYKEQSLNGIVIQDFELQPLKFQGQSLDIETGLHYNRFRYYDSDVGMFIQRDPIGLLGGNNVFQYAPNPIHWIDVLGLHKKKKVWSEGDVAPYGDKRHTNDGFDAHEMLRNAFLKNSPLTTITKRSEAKGNPAMALSKDNHKAVHDYEALLRAKKGMGRNEFFKSGKQEINLMYEAMLEVLVNQKKIITLQDLRNMKKQAIKFAKKHNCYLVG